MKTNCQGFQNVSASQRHTPLCFRQSISVKVKATKNCEITYSVKSLKVFVATYLAFKNCNTTQKVIIQSEQHPF